MAISCRVVVAGGEASGEQLPYRTAVALAERLGTEVVIFPGDHGGFTAHPDAFADKLHEVLRVNSLTARARARIT